MFHFELLKMQGFVLEMHGKILSPQASNILTIIDSLFFKNDSNQSITTIYES